MARIRSPQHLASELAALTGDLIAPPGGEEALAKLRQLVTQALASRADEGEKGSRTRAGEWLQIAKHALGLGGDASEDRPIARVTRRLIPVAAPDAARSLGPFLTSDGERVWFDVFLTLASRSATVVTGSGTLLLATGGATPSSDGREFDVGAGGLWVRARAVDTTADPQLYFGLRVTGGHGSSSAVISSTTPNQLALGPGATLRLELDIDVPAETRFFTPPRRVVLEFAGDALSSLEADAAHVSFDGAAMAIRPTISSSATFDSVAVSIPCDIDLEEDTASSASSAIRLSGRWVPMRAAWRHWCEYVDPASPSLPHESGHGQFEVDATIDVTWRGARGPLPLDHITVTAYATYAQMWAHAVHRGHQTLREPDRTLARLHIEPGAEVVVSRYASAAPESRLDVAVSAEIEAPRPLAANGEPLRIAGGGDRWVLHEGDGGLFAALSVRSEPARTALALSNALLIVEGPAFASLRLTLHDDGSVASARLTSTYELRGVIPLLADPYVANFDPVPRDGRQGTLLIRAAWGEDDEPDVTIELRAEENERSQILASWFPEPLWDHLDFHPFGTSRASLASDIGRQSCLHWLLDVSTNAGQFGVAIGNRGDVLRTSLEGSVLKFDGLDTLLFSVPAVQWEPVADSSGLMLSADDGGPSLLAVDTVRLVPVAPVDAARMLITASEREPATLQATFTLPFGIRASLDSNPREPGNADLLPSARVWFEEDPLGTLTAAPRVHFESTSPAGMRGRAEQTNNVLRAHAPGSPRTGTNVLAFAPMQSSIDVVDAMFNQKFGNRRSTLPLHRYDWSGYGASVFSHWRNLTQRPPNVSQVRFDVLNGRTSHEVIQVAAILWPCQAFLVRTITLERQNNASIVRWDSGWIASSDGRFTYPGTQCTFHRGVGGGYTHIREIRDTPHIVTIGTAQFQQVFFDADLEVDGVLTGARDGRVPVQRHIGFVQFAPASTDIDAATLAELLRREGSMGGAVDCEIEIGTSGPRVLVNRLLVGSAVRPPGTTEFVVAVNGMPRFPQAGDWTAVRTQGGQTTSVDPRIGLPLIREGVLAHRFAAPADLFRPLAPETTYGFLFSTRAHRVLLPSPEVAPGDRAITSPFHARAADPYAFAVTREVFPKTVASIEFPTPFTLDLGGPVVLAQQGAKRPGDLELASNKVMRLYVESAAAFDAAVNAGSWEMTSTEQTLCLDLLGRKKILAVRGKWEADAAGARKFKEANYELSDELKQVKEILDLLKKLKLPVDILFDLRTEGGGAMALEASMAGQLAEPDGSRIDTGMGKLSGSIRLGVLVRASINNSVQGCAFVEISGDLQQAIIPGLLYAGGHLRFRLGVFVNGDTQLELTAGTVGSLGGDLIKGLIEVEGTVKYGYTMMVPNNNFEEIRLGVVLGLEVRAVLLSGLVGVQFGWEGGALMGLDATQDNIIITAHVSASASVSAAWIFRARRSITVEYTTTVPRKLAATALALATCGVGPATVGAAAAS